MLVALSLLRHHQAQLNAEAGVGSVARVIIVDTLVRDDETKDS